MITYYNAVSADGPEVRAAVHDWNSSGAHVRFVAVSPSQAEVTISPMPADFFPVINLPGVGRVRNIDVTGFASVGFVPRWLVLPSPSGRERYRGAHVWLLAVGSRLGGVRLSPGTMINTAAHELGHVLGLGHELHACAVMNPSLGADCHPRHPWLYFCPDPLQPDDIRGAVALYGGREPRGGTRLCSLAPTPAAPHGLSAHLTQASSGTVRVQWTDPAGRTPPSGRQLDPYSLRGSPTIEGYQLYTRPGTCDAQLGTLAGEDTARGAERQHVDIQLADGPWCLRLRLQDAFGRSGATATLQTTIAGPGTPGSPTADFSEDPNVVAGISTTFQDVSQAGAARIITWRWTFGDGSTANTQNPQHVYGSPGTYTVTLTVTDAYGSTSTTSQAVQVVPAQPPSASFAAPTQVSVGDDVPFTDQSSQGTSPIVAWQWTFGDGTGATSENPDHVYTQAGSYTATLTVTAQDGRQDSTSQTITVNP